jgi:hypothetical protein
MPLPEFPPELPGRFVSPNEMMRAAKDIMLEGREPESPNDWALIVNFVATNVAAGLEESASKLFRVLYSIPLTEEQVVKIAQFQAQRRR